PAAHALHQPRDRGVAAVHRHRVDDTNGPVLGVELRLEHNRAGSVPALDPADATPGGDQPAPGRFPVEEGREHGAGIEPRQAEPVDRSVPPDERGGTGVADERVVLQRQSHDDILPRPDEGAVRPRPPYAPVAADGPPSLSPPASEVACSTACFTCTNAILS